MAVPVKYDIKCILFKAGDKGKTSHKSINLQSFINTMKKPLMQQRLHDGLLLGLLTHDGRSRARSGGIPHHDWVMKDPDLCNILREVTVKDGVVYGYLDLTDTPAAQRFKSLCRQGCKIGVSISTELVEGPDEFFIEEMMGVDFTLRSEMNSPIVEMNFSENDPRILDINDNPEFQIGNFSVGDGETSLTQVRDFSEEVTHPQTRPKKTFDTENNTEGPQKDFSVKEYIRERQRPPAMVLKQRIREIIQYSRLARPKVFTDNKSMLRRYILEYMNEWITKSLSDPKNDMNIALGLRLTEYCNDRMPMRDLQRYLKRARQQMEQNGAMTRDVQANLNLAFSKLMDEIYKYINSKVGDKRKLL